MYGGLSITLFSTPKVDTVYVIPKTENLLETVSEHLDRRWLPISI